MFAALFIGHHFSHSDQTRSTARLRFRAYRRDNGNRLDECAVSSRSESASPLWDQSQTRRWYSSDECSIHRLRDVVCEATGVALSVPPPTSPRSLPAHLWR